MYVATPYVQENISAVSHSNFKLEKGCHSHRRWLGIGLMRLCLMALDIEGHIWTLSYYTETSLANISHIKEMV